MPATAQIAAACRREADDADAELLLIDCETLADRLYGLSRADADDIAADPMQVARLNKLVLAVKAALREWE